MDNDYQVKVKELLNLKPFQEAKLITKSQKAKERIVKRINVLEVPDITDWKMKNELLLTQGFSLKNAKDRKRLIKTMVEKGASGMAVKPKRYLEKIPDDMIELANELDFPLIELPFDLTFSEIITSVMNMINSRQTMILEQNVKTHKELMNIVLKGGDIDSICDKISNSINNTVIIEDKYGKAMSYCIKTEADKEYKVVEDMIKVKYYENEKTSSTNFNYLKYKDKYKELKIPIITEVEFYGYICVLETVKPSSGFDIIAVENATAIIALAIMKKKTVEEVEKRHLNEFLDLIITGDYEDEEEIVRQGEYYGVNALNNYNIMIINFSDLYEEKPIVEKEETSNHLRNKIHNIAKFTISIEGYQGIVGTKSSDIIIVIETEEFIKKDILNEKIMFLSEQILNNVKKELRIEKGIIISISRNYPGVKASRSYREAKEALMINQNNNFLAKEIINFRDLGIFRLLHHIPHKELDAFLDEYLHPILTYDKENDCELIKTLEAYFMSNENIKETAKYLFVHYNTIVYRLQKIKDIIGHNFGNWDERLNLQVAIKLLKLNYVKAEKCKSNKGSVKNIRRKKGEAL